MAVSRKSNDSSVEIADYPRRNEKILRNFDLLLPKFHFVLPNFHFPTPWGIFVSSLRVPDFLRREVVICRPLEDYRASVEERADEREVVAGTSEVSVAAVRSSRTPPRCWRLVHILLRGQRYAYRL